MTLKSACFGALIALIGLLAASTAPVTAAASFTLTESSSTMTYGLQSPMFRATLTVPAGDPGPGGNNMPVLMVGSTGYAPSISGTGPTYNLFWSGFDATALLPGDHSIYATYPSPVGGTINSNAVTLTVFKSTPQLTCGLTTASAAYTYARGAAYPIECGSQFAGDAFTVSFAGAQTFSSGPITADATGRVPATVPSVPGIYHTTITLDGNATQNAVTLNARDTIVSLQNRPTIALYVSPTPLTWGTLTTWRVVVSGSAGTPTGGVDLRIGSSYIKGTIPLSGGAVTFTATAPPMAATDHVQVGYYGDPLYSSAIVDFPLDPPALSTGGASGASTSQSASAGQAMNPPKGTALSAPSSPEPAAISSPLPSSAASSAKGLAHVMAAAVVTPSSARLLDFALGAAAIIVVLGSIALVTWRRRQRTSTTTLQK